MTYVRQTEPQPLRHACGEPMLVGSDGLVRPAGGEGTLWRCDDCDQLWQVVMFDGGRRSVWERARWWQRLRYRRAR